MIREFVVLLLCMRRGKGRGEGGGQRLLIEPAGLKSGSTPTGMLSSDGALDC